MLDGVEDPQNVGAILRSVDAPAPTAWSGRRGMRRRSTAPPAKASAGAVNHVRIATVVNIARALEELQGAGRVDRRPRRGRRPEAYDAVDYTLPTALVVGAEGTGLRRLVRETCDRLVTIPMAGGCRA